MNTSKAPTLASDSVLFYQHSLAAALLLVGRQY
jgi:hypothetical protein